MQRYRWATIWLLTVAGFVIGHAGAAIAQAPYTLRYAVDTERNINELSQRVAERQGFFAREGINLEIHRFVASPIARRCWPRGPTSMWRGCNCRN